MAHLPTNTIINYLSKHGPTRLEDLPKLPIEGAKEQGVLTFPDTTGHKTAQPFRDESTPVCYLEPHNRETVLTEFLDTNPRLVKATPSDELTQILGGQGQRWEEAAKVVVPNYYDRVAEFHSDSHHTSPEHELKRCDFCNEPIGKSHYPNHLARKCPQT